MKKTGFIGLGHLGKAMAKRLIAEGVDLVVWNRTVEKTQDLGVELAASPAEVTNKGDVIFLSLFDSAAVSAVLTGPGGLLEGDVAGKVIVDTTTNHFFDVLGFHEACSKKGCAYLEAPVLGSVIPASQGNLVIQHTLLGSPHLQGSSLPPGPCPYPEGAPFYGNRDEGGLCPDLQGEQGISRHVGGVRGDKDRSWVIGAGSWGGKGLCCCP